MRSRAAFALKAERFVLERGVVRQDTQRLRKPHLGVLEPPLFLENHQLITPEPSLLRVCLAGALKGSQRAENSPLR